MSSNTEMTRSSNKTKESQVIHSEYCEAIRELVIINTHYKSNMAGLYEEYAEKEANLRFSQEKNMAKIKMDFLEEKSHLYNLFENAVKELEESKRFEISRIKSNAERLIKDVAQLMANIHGAMQQVDLVLNRVHLNHWLSSKKRTTQF